MVLGEAVTLLASGDRPPGLLPAREEMAVSLGFHIITERELVDLRSGLTGIALAGIPA